MPTPQIGQTHSNNLQTVADIADELLEYVWPFCGVGASRVNICHTESLLLMIQLISCFTQKMICNLTHTRPIFNSYRNQLIGLHCKSIHWFLYQCKIDLIRLSRNEAWRYTNADLKISQYVCVLVKILP